MTKEELEVVMNYRLNEFTLQLSEHLAQTIRGEVKATVNGKIDSLRISLEDYKKEDYKWKERAEPMVRTYESASWLVKGLTAIVIFLATVGGVIEFIIKFFIKK